jgi:hypothetical protein
MLSNAAGWLMPPRNRSTKSTGLQQMAKHWSKMAAAEETATVPG